MVDKTVSKKALREAIDVYNELLRVHQLNIEFLETLELTLFSIQNFCRKRNIPLQDKKLASLLGKAITLLDEISAPPNLQHQKSAIRRIFTEEESDKDFTEPYFRINELF